MSFDLKSYNPKAHTLTPRISQAEKDHVTALDTKTLQNVLKAYGEATGFELDFILPSGYELADFAQSGSSGMVYPACGADGKKYAVKIMDPVYRASLYQGTESYEALSEYMVEGFTRDAQTELQISRSVSQFRNEHLMRFVFNTENALLPVDALPWVGHPRPVYLLCMPFMVTLEHWLDNEPSPLHVLTSYTEADEARERNARKPGPGGTEALVRKLAAELCEGLSALHNVYEPYMQGDAGRLSILHRDIKPNNIYVDVSMGRPRFVLSDFSISTIVERNATDGIAVETAVFGAPELRNKDACPTVRSDIFSLGMVLYYAMSHNISILSGSKSQRMGDCTAFRKALDTEEDHLSFNYRPIGCSLPFWNLIMEMVRIDPKERLCDVSTLEKRLAKLRPIDPARKYWLPAVMGLLLVVAVLTAVQLSPKTIEMADGVYYGYLKNGQRSGQGTFTWADTQSVYEGVWAENYPNGQGTFTFADGETQTGAWSTTVEPESGNIIMYKDGQANGYCSIARENFEYRGECRNNGISGAGKLVTLTKQENGGALRAEYSGNFSGYGCTENGEIRYGNGDIYTGETMAYSPNGTGVMRYADGSCYDGKWALHEMTTGRFSWADGATYFGAFKEGHPDGEGIYTFTNGTEQSGSWAYAEDMPLEMTDAFDQPLYYTGMLLDGKPNGRGCEYTLGERSAPVYQGEYCSGAYDGYGCYRYSENSPLDTVPLRLCALYGSYTGFLKNGLANGEGSFVSALNRSDAHGESVTLESMLAALSTPRRSGAGYTGVWANGCPNGEGSYTYENGFTMTGNWSAEDAVVFTDETGAAYAVYSGWLADGEINGAGRLVWSDDSSYTGEWYKAQRYEYGIMAYSDGSSKIGYWQDDALQEGAFSVPEPNAEIVRPTLSLSVESIRVGEKTDVVLVADYADGSYPIDKILLSSGNVVLQGCTAEVVGVSDDENGHRKRITLTNVVKTGEEEVCVILSGSTAIDTMGNLCGSSGVTLEL